MQGKFKIAVFFVLLGGMLAIYPNTNTGKGSPDEDSAAQRSQHNLPSAVQKKLNELKTSDSLEAWLNTWYGYLSDNPTSHFDELTIPLQTIWRQPKTDAEKVASFYLLIFTGYYELQQGNILRSIDVYEQAYRLTLSTKAIYDSEILEYLIKPLGNNYTRLGDYERALFIQERGLQMARNIGDSMQVASALANMSTTARWNNQLDDALRYSTQALQISRAGSSLRGLICNTRADILLSMGEIDSAEVFAGEALRILSNENAKNDGNNAYWYTGALMTSGSIAEQKLKFSEATRFYENALEALKKYFPHSRQRERMKALWALGKIKLSQKQYEQSRVYFDNALHGLIPGYTAQAEWPQDSTLYAENTLMDVLAGKAKLLEVSGKYDEALEGYQKAAVVLQQLREAVFSREAKLLLQQQSQYLTEAAISLAYKCYTHTKKTKYAEMALEFTEQHKARLLLNDLQTNISYAQIQKNDSTFLKQKQLHQAIAFYTHAYVDALSSGNDADSLRWKQNIDAARYQLSLTSQEIKKKFPGIGWDAYPQTKELYKQLPKETAAWEYFIGNNEWYSLEMDCTGIRQFTSLGDAGSLYATVAHFVDHWFSEGIDHQLNEPEAYFRDAAALYKTLKVKKPAGHSNLLIMPDGVLGRLPFGALMTDTIYQPNPGKWPYLLLQAVPTQCYSLAVWDQLRSTFTQPKSNKGFTGFFIDSTGDKRLATLTAVKEEEEKVRTVISGRYFENKQASGDRLIGAMQNSEVVHLSTHAFLMGDKQMPALQMADKKLLLADLYGVQTHPSLVVLSACQTANGLLSPGEGIISLSREFTTVGVGGVVAALWNINDEAVAQLTASFYEKLKLSGDKAAALHTAQTDWLQSPDRDEILKLPYYWAGLVYYGNDVPLAHPLHSANAFSGWMWVLCGIAGVLLTWKIMAFFRRK